MKTRLVLFGALSLVAMGVQAGTLKIVNVNAPAYNYLFSTNGSITVNDTVSTFTTNLPPYTTNLAQVKLSGLIQSRTFQGKPGAPEAGLNAYEYRLVLNKLTNAASVSISSMTLKFSPFSSFAYLGQSNNQAWVVTSGGIGSVGPSSAAASGSQVTFNFNPPLTFSGASNQEVSSYFWGMISSHPPPKTANTWATFTGSERLLSGGSNSFSFLTLRVRAP
jgi:hypothetical protein